jgi:hypothetical protein
MKDFVDIIVDGYGMELSQSKNHLSNDLSTQEVLEVCSLLTELELPENDMSEGFISVLPEDWI